MQILVASSEFDVMTAAPQTQKLNALATFLRAYIRAHGNTHGMVSAAAARFATSRSRIRHRISRLNGQGLATIETEPST